MGLGYPWASLRRRGVVFAEKCLGAAAIAFVKATGCVNPAILFGLFYAPLIDSFLSLLD